MTKVTDDQFRAAHAEGLTNFQLCERLGLAYPTVRQRMSRLGLTAHPVRRCDFEETKRLHAQGLSTKEIAVAQNATPDAIFQRLKKLGLKANVPVKTEAQKTSARRAAEKRNNERRRQERVRERARLMSRAFAFDACPVPEELLGRVMANLHAAEPRV